MQLVLEKLVVRPSINGVLGLDIEYNFQGPLQTISILLDPTRAYNIRGIGRSFLGWTVVSLSRAHS